MPGRRKGWKAWLVPSPDFPVHLEAEFRLRYNESNAPIASTGILIGIFIMLAFYFWDVVVDYAHSTQTLIVRLLVAAWMVFTIRLPQRMRVKYCQELFASTIALGGLGVVLIISIVHDGLNIGLSGVMIVLMFNFGFLRLLFIPSLISGGIVCLAYIVAAIIAGLDPLLIVANNFFLVSSLFAGASVTYLLERLFRDQFLAERELIREREILAQRSRNDTRYLAWLRQLAVFLRHEVRHPVAQISSSIEIAQLASKDDERIAPHLERAILSSQHVWNLIERASSATDAEAFVRRFQPNWTDLQKLLAEQVEVFRHSNSGVQFELRSSPPLDCYLDPTLIREAVANLLSNAASFADAETTIEVGLTTNDVHAIIRVRNRGPLIAGDPEVLFGPFTSSRPSGEHQGIGLYVFRLIAEQHGGTASIDNLDDGSGVEASMALPLRTTPRTASDSRGHVQT